MAKLNKTLSRTVAALIAVSLIAAVIALNTNLPDIDPGITVTAPESASAKTAVEPVDAVVITALSDSTMPPVESESGKLPIHSADNAATLALGADLRQAFYQSSGEYLDFQSMSEAQIFDLLDQLHTQGKSGDDLANIKWLALAFAYCANGIARSTNPPTFETYKFLLSVLPTDEAQFTEEFLRKFETTGNELDRSREQKCREKTGAILSDKKSMDKMLTQSGSALSFLIQSDNFRTDQVRLLSAQDRDELLRLPDPLRALIANEMIETSNEDDSCIMQRTILPFVQQGTGPNLLAARALLSTQECGDVSGDQASAVEILEQAASFGDRSIIDQYLIELQSTQNENYRIERAAWNDFIHLLARNFCYGNQTLNTLARYYHNPENRFATLSVFEASQAEQRSTELQARYLDSAKHHLGCNSDEH